MHDRLAADGLEIFLPIVGVWSRRAGARRLTGTPLFPGYLFLRHALDDKTTWVEVRKVRGVVGVLGHGWDRPATVPDPEIEAIRRLLASGGPALPHVYLKEGRRVRIVHGPLAGMEGILIGNRIGRGLFVVSVHLLRRSVAVELDCTAVEAAA